MKFLRVLLAVIILIIAIVIFVVGGLIMLVDPNKLKPIIISEVKRQSGYQLVIDSNLAWSFYPQFSVNIPHAKMTAPGASTPFLDLSNTKIATDLLGLWKDYQSLRGDIYISNLVFNKMRAQNVSVKLNWQNKVISFSPITADLYQGKFYIVLQGCDFPSKPKWTWHAQITNVAVEPLLQDLEMNSKVNISGKANITLQAQAIGMDKNTFLQTMHGVAQLNINNGILHGIDINYLLQSADALINKKPLVAENTRQTNFATLTSDFKIENALIATNNFNLSSAQFSANAKGNINMLAQTIQMQLLVNPKGVNEKLQIPILVTGELRRPEIALDMNEIGNLLARQELDKVKARVQEEINKRLPQATEFLQKFLGR